MKQCVSTGLGWAKLKRNFCCCYWHLSPVVWSPLWDLSPPSRSGTKVGLHCVAVDLHVGRDTHRVCCRVFLILFNMVITFILLGPSYLTRSPHVRMGLVMPLQLQSVTRTSSSSFAQIQCSIMSSSTGSLLVLLPLLMLNPPSQGG